MTGMVIVLLALVMAGILLLIIVQGARNRRPSLGDGMLIVPAEIDPDAANDPVMLEAIQNGRKIEAIKHYRELAGVDLKDAKEAVEYLMAGGTVGKKQRAMPPIDTAAGVRDLLAEGQKDEAVDLYARFAGVDEYTARDAVDAIEREMRLEDDPSKLSLLERGEIQALLQAGNKIEAVKRYRELSGLGLKEAKDAVDAMEQGLS